MLLVIKILMMNGLCGVCRKFRIDQKMIEIGSAVVCRMCLNNDITGILKLNSNCASNGISYYEMLKEITNFLYQEYDFICGLCRDELLACYEFIKKLQQNELKFKKLCEVGNSDLWNNEAKTENKETNCELFQTNQIQNTLSRSLEEFHNIKDPLEESDDEKISVKNSYETLRNDAIPNNGSDFDEEDNKPLNEILKEEIEDSSSEDLKPKAVSNAERFEVDFNDPNASIEDMIFPKGRFNCELCSRTYFTTMGLEAHMNIHSTNMPPRTRRRRKHAKSIKENSEKNLSLDNSAQSFSESVTAEGEIIPDMSLNFEENVGDPDVDSNAPKLNSNRKNWKPKKIFPCNVCGKHMISASKLRYHMVMHTGEKNYLCSMCPKAYSTIYALKHHFRIHTNERPYVCNFCGDRFLRPTTLKSHVRRHTGERPYSCDICGKKFIQHSSMATHIKLNHLAKTIQCSYCDKKYARQTDLTTHLLSHTGEKKFQCHLCPNRRFIRQANLNKHLNQHHPEYAKQKAESQRLAKAAPLKQIETSTTPNADITQ